MSLKNIGETTALKKLFENISKSKNEQSTHFPLNSKTSKLQKFIKSSSSIMNSNDNPIIGLKKLMKNPDVFNFKFHNFLIYIHFKRYFTKKLTKN